MNRETSLLTMYTDNVVDVTFRLRDAGTREPLNLAGHKLKMSVNQVTPVPRSDIPSFFAEANHPKADPAVGFVVFKVDRRVTGKPGTYTWALTRIGNGEEVTLLSGQFNVIPRAGWPDNFIHVSPVLTGEIVVSS